MNKELKKATMKDVAKLANVSQAIVSHIINGTVPVSEETTARVRKAIKELDYFPNALAKGLKQKKTNTVGFLIPDIGSGYYSEIAKRVEVKLREFGFFTFFCNTFYDSNLEKLYIETLIQENVQGILLGYGLVNKKIYEEIQKLGINLVLLDDKEVINGVQVPSVEISNINGSFLAVQHLYNTGAKNICFASEPLFNRSLQLRYEGFCKAVKQFAYEESNVSEYIEKIFTIMIG